jgi:hypothetical protein
MRRRIKTRDTGDWLLDLYEQTVIKGVNAGMDSAVVIERANEALITVIDDQAPALASSLRRRAPHMLREHRNITRKFERRLHQHWGRALDQYYAILVGAMEVGENFAYRNEKKAREDGDLVYEAVVGIHARACRVAGEIHILLAAGLPHGARARCRTLHELAVTAFAMTEFGRKVEFADLGERFFKHDAVMRYREACDFQERCEQLGHEPFTDEEMAQMEAECDRHVQQCGAPFKKENGWVAHLVPSRQFRDLEKLVNLSHLRSHYAWASNEVHSGIRGWTQNHYEWRGQTYRLAGRTNSELAEPASMALNIVVSSHGRAIVRWPSRCAVTFGSHGYKGARAAVE